ncbi:hypothetical protein ABE41_006530 [Fictibacillus arsenicus]|uniref:Sigma-54 factor interaction domain-containing protein n=1 Tax=Fictibacillus arsenicus TaxID=255247 RepID=A0A1B1Z2K1_9BACL|nr:sigma-54-dependent Fis family transcriptional regulator [Fictibacillus arsenicus]ANX11658.1 hypothetical protein ABE41_006530 [Fictibacillus arsenicus]
MKRRLNIPSSDYVNFNSSVQKAWSAYIEKDDLSEGKIRTDILNSWERSKQFGVDPFQLEVKEVVQQDDLIYRREKNDTLLSFALPDMKYLSDSLQHTDTIVTISDKNGVILNSFGDTAILKKGEKVRHMPGAVWTEEVAGTNAIGTVLKSKKPVQVLFTEHFCTGWHDWYCAAAPILNPFTKELLGVFDITGKSTIINPHTIGLAISKANHISKYIEQNVYQYGLKLNPFLNATLDSTEDGIIIADAKKNILKMNVKTELYLKNMGVKSLKHLGELDALVNLVLEGQENTIEHEITLHKDNSRYICSVIPIIMDQELLGVVIRLRVSKPNSKLMKTSVTKVNQLSSTKYNFGQLIGKSPNFLKSIKLAEKASLLNSTLLLSGETGTGKEIFAQSIHHASERKNEPFIAINCAAIPRELIESELFGYESGSFTGAKSKGSQGKFELAKGGTIFLDEIGDMPLKVQVHLLRVLEEKVVTRIGGEKPIPIDVRIISATHKNLIDEVHKEQFRQDLLYRLRVIQIRLPSLRERTEDIPLLVKHFVKKFSPQFTDKDVLLPIETIQLLKKYQFPGNIRELKNIVEQSLFNMEGNVLHPYYLPSELIESVEHPIDFEKEQLIAALTRMSGNITNVAIDLGISRATLYRKLKKYGIQAKF